MWWVIQEGFLGKFVNALTVGPALNVYTTVQSATRPKGAVAGPFHTRAEAQTFVDRLNAGAVATPGNIANQAAQSGLNAATGGLDDLAQRLTQSHTWQRVGEVVAGFILFYVGLKAFFPTTVNTVKSAGKTAAKGALFL